MDVLLRVMFVGGRVPDSSVDRHRDRTHTGANFEKTTSTSFELFVGGDVVDPRAAVLAHDVVARLQLALLDHLLGVLQHVHAGVDDPCAQPREIQLPHHQELHLSEPCSRTPSRFRIQINSSTKSRPIYRLPSSHPTRPIAPASIRAGTTTA